MTIDRHQPLIKGHRASVLISATLGGFSETEMSKEDRPPNKAESRKQFLRWLTTAVVDVLVAAVAWYVIQRPTEQEPLSDVFETLERQGYQPDTSLSGPFLPGNVLQVAEPGPDGEGRPLPTPILFLRAEDCFSGQTLEEMPFPLPEVDGTSKASLGLEAARLSRVLPGLEAQDTAKAKYRMKFDRPQRLIYAKGDLSNLPVGTRSWDAWRSGYARRTVVGNGSARSIHFGQATVSVSKWSRTSMGGS